MRTNCKLILLATFFFTLSFGNVCHAQNISIELGPDNIGENQAWTITVTVQNDRLKSYDNFPDFQGFRKRGTSSQTSTNIFNGQISTSQSVVMTYMPVAQGTYTLPAFKMKVNDKIISSPGKQVTVGAPVQRRDPFRSFFDRDDSDDFFGNGKTEFVDIKEDAFLALTTNKDEVYVGEGFNTTLSFFVAESNQAPLSFYELGKQLTDIMKKLRPANCWEENFNIENIEGESITINGKRYKQYKIYQGTFYPLNTDPVKFPSIGLEMIKYKVAKNPSFFGQRRQEDFKKFYTKAKTVRVKELPPHPLKNTVAVGNYHLSEKIPTDNLETGQSTSFEFNIFGEGNIASVNKPTVAKDGNFEIYEPNIQQNINRQGNRVTGTKSFNYFLIPKEPGDYNLGDYFQWIFFNVKENRYDTLRSEITVHVSGESKKNEAIQATDPGVFYDKIDNANNTLHAVSNDGWQKFALHGFIILSLAGSAYLVFRKQS